MTERSTGVGNILSERFLLTIDRFIVVKLNQIIQDGDGTRERHTLNQITRAGVGIRERQALNQTIHAGDGIKEKLKLSQTIHVGVGTNARQDLTRSQRRKFFKWIQMASCTSRAGNRRRKCYNSFELIYSIRFKLYEK
jgi:hypothetical protein